MTGSYYPWSHFEKKNYCEQDIRMKMDNIKALLCIRSPKSTHAVAHVFALEQNCLQIIYTLTASWWRKKKEADGI